MAILAWNLYIKHKRTLNLGGLLALLFKIIKLFVGHKRAVGFGAFGAYLFFLGCFNY